MTTEQMYSKLLAETAEKAHVQLLLDWIENHDRKPAELAFTQGPERRLAYALEPILAEAENYRLLRDRATKPSVPTTPLVTTWIDTNVCFEPDALDQKMQQIRAVIAEARAK